MPAPRADSRADQPRIRLQAYEEYRNCRTLAEALPIGALQRGARRHGPTVAGDSGADRSTKALEPRPTIIVFERNARRHPLDIVNGMVLVAFEERGAQRFRQAGRQGRLPTSTHSHDNDGERLAHSTTRRHHLSAAWGVVSLCTTRPQTFVSGEPCSSLARRSRFIISMCPIHHLSAGIILALSVVKNRKPTPRHQAQLTVRLPWLPGTARRNHAKH
jgi:hypothetical protein